IAAGVLACNASSSRPTTPGADESVRASLAAGVDSLDLALDALDRALASQDRNEGKVHRAFRNARERYKGIEGALEFYAPALAAAFNSRRQEVDDDDAPPPSTLAPGGFPALEALIWPTFDGRMSDSARRIVTAMRPLATRARTLVPELHPTSAQIIELAR